MNIEYGLEICFAKDYNSSTKNTYIKSCLSALRLKDNVFKDSILVDNSTLSIAVSHLSVLCLEMHGIALIKGIAVQFHHGWSLARRTIVYHGTLTGSPSTSDPSDFRKPDYTATCLLGQRISPVGVPSCTSVYHYVPLCTSMYHYVPECNIMYHYVAACTTGPCLLVSSCCRSNVVR